MKTLPKQCHFPQQSTSHTHIRPVCIHMHVAWMHCKHKVCHWSTPELTSKRACLCHTTHRSPAGLKDSTKHPSPTSQQATHTHVCMHARTHAHPHPHKHPHTTRTHTTPTPTNTPTPHAHLHPHTTHPPTHTHVRTYVHSYNTVQHEKHNSDGAVVHATMHWVHHRQCVLTKYCRRSSMGGCEP